MLAIRMQRTGRSGHASFRVVVQDSRQSPTSGKFVALLGSYDPHAKTTTLASDKAKFYLEHGAQPSERVAKLFKQEGIKLPQWVATPTKKKGEIRNAEKLRRNRPADAEPKAKEVPAADVAPAGEVAEKTESDQPPEVPTNETSQPEAIEEPAAEAEEVAEAPAQEETVPAEGSETSPKEPSEPSEKEQADDQPSPSK